MHYTCLAQDCVTRVVLSRSDESGGGGGGGLRSYCRPELYNIFRVPPNKNWKFKNVNSYVF